MLRIYTISAILGLAIAGSVFLFQNSPLVKEESRIVQEGKSGNLTNLSTGKPFVEQLKVNQLTGKQNGINENLTDSFAQRLAEKIAQNNPAGAQIMDGRQAIAVPDPDQIAADLLAEAYQNLNPQELIPKINDKDLKIINNQALAAYAEAFDEISSKTAMPDSQNSAELNAKLPALIKSYQGAIDSLYKLPVPELFVEVHKTKIAYLTAQLKLLEKMKAVQQDPVAAMLASQNFLALEEEFYEEFQNNMFEIADYFASKQR